MEQWKSVVGYEGYYEISDQGNVRGVDRRSSGQFIRGIEKSLHTSTSGYIVVSLSKEGKNTTHLVHRLMASAFLPNPDILSEIDHIDRNCMNNTLSNLRWCDRKTNIANRAKFEMPLGVTGERNIIITPQGHYQVRLSSRTCLGTRPTLEEAIALRESGAVDHQPRIGKSNNQYISVQHNGTFIVRKKTDGVMINYGTFKTIEEAIVVRNTIPGYTLKSELS